MTTLVARQPLLRRAVVTMPGLRSLAWRFVAGENLDSAIRVVHALERRGIRAIVNNVGTHVTDRAEAVSAGNEAVEALDRLHREGLDPHLSLKLTQIGLDIDEDLGRTQLRSVLDHAQRLGGFVRIDMEEAVYKDRTIRLFEEMRDSYGPATVGIALQSYLRDGRADLERLMASGSRIRLVKGGYWESPDIVFQKHELDDRFGSDLDLLLREGEHPAIATHDVPFIERIRDLVARGEIDPDSFELEVLYGVRRDLYDDLVRDGITLRCYVPYGEQWYEYVLGCVRRLPGGVLRRFRGGARDRG